MKTALITIAATFALIVTAAIPAFATGVTPGGALASNAIAVSVKPAATSQAQLDRHITQGQTPRVAAATLAMEKGYLSDQYHNLYPEAEESGPSVEKAANDCHGGLDTGCKYYDTFNNEFDDTDCDCIADFEDNCPLNKNYDQADTDGDGIGDACTDSDEDGVMDDLDNCLDIANPDQADVDGDRVGDACEDSDNDGYLDFEDNCPLDGNTTQRDTDEDTVGDVCDNCPLVSNEDQFDTDDNLVGDACDNDDDGDAYPDLVDNCPLRYNPDQDDVDGDGVGDICDNCLDTFNAEQVDSDSDGVGDACEIVALPSTDASFYSFGDGGCSLNPAGTSAGLFAGLIMLAIAAMPAIIRRRIR